MTGTPWQPPAMGINASSALRTTLREAAERGWGEPYLVRQIANIIPLDERRRRAVVNFRRNLRDKGVPPQRIEKLTAEYAKKLKKQRAAMIARTEATKKLTEQRHESWGVNDGTYVVRRWVAKKGACALCQALHGTTTTGQSHYHGLYPGPPCHPNCRCTEEVVTAEWAEGETR